MAHPFRRGFVFLPPGLTDEGTPGIFRWSAYAAARMERGESPFQDGRGVLSPLEAWGRNDGSFRVAGKGMEFQEVAVPITVPCVKHHQNRIDDEAPSA